MTTNRAANIDRPDEWEDYYLGEDGKGPFVRCPTPRMSDREIAADQKRMNDYQRSLEKAGEREKWRTSGAAREAFSTADREARVAQQSAETKAKIEAWRASLKQ